LKHGGGQEGSLEAAVPEALRKRPARGRPEGSREEVEALRRGKAKRQRPARGRLREAGRKLKLGGEGGCLQSCSPRGSSSGAEGM